MTRIPRTKGGMRISLETQVMETKAELVLELRERTTTVTVKEFTPAGARIEYNSQGEVTGEYNAMHIETVSVLTKPNGTFEFEGRAIDSTREGDMILVTYTGRGEQTPTMAKFESEDSYQTVSPRLAWLNTTKTRGVGTYNFATGEAVIRFYKK